MIHSSRLIGRLTLRQLQVFYAVYSEKSYSRAGELLGLTQPAVSSQVRQLEAVTGVRLFEYIGRRLFVTAAGTALARSTRHIFSELEQLEHQVSELKGVVAGELRIVTVNSAQNVVPYLLRAFLSLYPDVHVSVAIVNRAEALQRLASNNDDLVILGLAPEDRQLKILPFMDNELIPVVPAGHPLLTSARAPSGQRFLDNQLLLREPGSGSRLALELHCKVHRLKLNQVMELGSNDAIKHAVLAGLGVAILPRLSVLQELKRGDMVEVTLQHFPIRRSWSVVYPESKHPTPAMRAFITYIQQNIAEFDRIFMRLQQQDG